LHISLFESLLLKLSEKERYRTPPYDEEAYITSSIEEDFNTFLNRLTSEEDAASLQEA